MSFLNAIIDWIMRLLFDVIKPVKIGDHIFMPLFYKNLTGALDTTWNYMSKSDAEKQHLRNYIKANVKSGETKATCFCLTPQNINGGLIDDKTLTVTDGMLGYLESKCKELIEDGIAVFLCLYVDDSAPRWFAIESHKALWARIHGKVGKCVTGYILSIETNEYANSMSHIEGCINVMRSVMPGAAWYETHLQWVANNGKYIWNSITNLPKNADLILAEYSWDPHKGDAVGLENFKNEYFTIQKANPTLKFVSHEYNLNVGSAVFEAQRAFLRAQGAWGIG